MPNESWIHTCFLKDSSGKMFQKYLLPTTNVKRKKQEKKITPTTCGSTPWAPHPALPLQHFFSSTLDRQHQSTIHDNITIRQIQVPKCFTNTCFQLHTTSGESFLCPTFQQLTGCVVDAWRFFRNAARTLEIRNLTLNMLQNAATDKVKIQGWKCCKYGAKWKIQGPKILPIPRNKRFSGAKWCKYQRQRHKISWFQNAASSGNAMQDVRSSEMSFFWFILFLYFLWARWNSLISISSLFDPRHEKGCGFSGRNAL